MSSQPLHGDLDRGWFKLLLMGLLESVDAERMDELLDTLACNDRVIEFVTQQIIRGWTELGSHGGKDITASPAPSGLSRAIREIAKASGDVARAEIERLEHALADERTRHSRTIADLCNARDKLSLLRLERSRNDD